MNTKDIVHFKGRSAGTLRPFESLGRVFEDLFDLPTLRGDAAHTPQIDIKETEKAIEVSVALPGVEKKDIILDLTENSLAISCERRAEKEEKDQDGYRLREQSYGRFYRAFTLPAAVKTEDAKAVYKNGALKITIQKQKADKARQINIE